MQPLTEDTIGGFNAMIEEQRGKGDAVVTTALFDHEYELLHERVDIKQIQPITQKEYFARGNTALLDAMGRTIKMVKARLDKTPEEERPGKVIFVITTDGQENSSREFDKATVKKLIEKRQRKQSWTFLFLGANMDAVSEASSLGINKDFARTYVADSAGTQRVWGAVNMAMERVRRPDFDVNDKDGASYAKTMCALDMVHGDDEAEKKDKKSSIFHIFKNK